MDQLSEKFISSSPYAYVMNNPAMFFDPDGRDIRETATGWTFTGKDINLIGSYFGSGGSFGNLSDQLGSYGGNFGNGNGGISNFWSSFNGGNTFGGVSVNTQKGYLSWWTNGANLGGDNIQGLDGHRTKIDQSGFNAFMDKNTQGNQFSSFLGGLGNLTNAGEVAWGASEMAAKYKGSSLATAMGIEARQVSMQMPKFLGVASKVGRTIGTVGYAASALSISAKIVNGEKISTSEKVSFGINTAIYGAGFILAGTAAAPFVAAGALIYGGAELGSYFFTGESIEDQIFGN